MGEDKDFERLKGFIELREREAELDAELKAVKAEIEEAKAGIIDRWADEGVSSVKVDRKTVYLHRQVWAGKAAVCVEGQPLLDEKGRPVKVSDDDFIDAVREVAPELVRETVNSSSLSAFVRELPEDEFTGLPILPDEFVGKIGVTEKVDVRVRGIKKKR